MNTSAPNNRRVPPRADYPRWGLLLLALSCAAAFSVTCFGPAARAGEPGAEGAEVESLAAIRAAATSFIRSQLPGDENIAAITAGPLDGRLRLPRCPTGLHAALPAGASVQSRSIVGVSCTGTRHWSVYVPVVVESQISVLVLRHPVANDAHLKAEDVAVQSRKVTGLSTAFLVDVTDLHGRTVRRPLPAGTALTIEMFTSDPVVHRGQEVTLLAQNGAFEVRAAGKALADAPAGGRLKVQNLSSLKIVEGVVVNSDVIQVAE